MLTYQGADYIKKESSARRFSAPIHDVHVPSIAEQAVSLLSLDYSFREKIEPGLPIASPLYVVEQFIVMLPMSLEIEAHVQHRFAQHLMSAEQQCDQQPAQAAVF